MKVEIATEHPQLPDTVHEAEGGLRYRREQWMELESEASESLRRSGPSGPSWSEDSVAMNLGSFIPKARLA
ncbi:hypothetical protein MVI01_04490 [Myxococcus virescens]|uniref:Uncharacterized protein n=1 Tax=Myxococcus virescens TaxID=83456 RepID=A0A511H572_9BACT|nr:hypothetical protein MVI01_04490 [Myxococcus virescens]